MSDDLERLQAALKMDASEIEETAKTRALLAGLESFDRVNQGIDQRSRPSAKASRFASPLQQGLKTMWTRITSRPFLLATTSLCTIALAVVITQQNRPLRLAPLGDVAPLASEGDIAAPKSVVVADERADGAALLKDKSVEESVVVQAPIAPAQDAAMASPDVAAVEGRLRSENAQTLAREAEKGLVTGRAVDSLAASGLAESMPSPSIVAQESDAELYRLQQDQPSGDVFDGAPVNPLKITAQEPVSTFAIDVDTASYSYVRSALLDGYRPQADAVRIEELVNYFDYTYPKPADTEVPFQPSVSVSATPWNPGTKLVHIAIQGFTADESERAPANLVFLIDTSGSMEDANKLPLLVQSFRLMLANLQPDDRIAIVTYAGSAGLVLEPTKVSDQRKILASLQNLSAGGSTAGAEGLQQAYGVAEDMAGDGSARVILATDGDFNVGIADPEELKNFIAAKRDTGVFLSVLGFGRGNYDDATMQVLAQNGNGQAAYIDTLAEAQKVLVEDVAATLVPIANDVKIQVEWNPATVAEYRLIGYETRALNREDFNNDRVDAGEIGSGHTVTALYEITLVGSSAVMTDDLRYESAAAAPETNFTSELGFLKLRYKLPGATTSQLIETPITPDRVDIAPQETAFAAAVAGFGELLRDNQAMGDWSHDDAQTLAQSARGEDTFGYRAEFIRLIGLAKAAQ